LDYVAGVEKNERTTERNNFDMVLPFVDVEALLDHVELDQPPPPSIYVFNGI
jgi:hypothetical protein